MANKSELCKDCTYNFYEDKDNPFKEAVVQKVPACDED